MEGFIMRYDKLLNNKRFKALVKKQRDIVSRFPRSKYISSLSRNIQSYLEADKIRTKSSFVKNFR
jgi:hypothetical protein